MRNRWKWLVRTAVAFAAASLMVASFGCGDEGAPMSAGGEADMNDDEGAGANNDTNGTPGDNDSDGPPEEPEEYDFARPVIVDHEVYVANQSLNSVAIIDSRNMSIETVMTGDRPMEVAGPADDVGDERRVMTLDRGSSTVTIIDPDGYDVSQQPVLSGSNRIETTRDGQVAVTWFDEDEAASGDRSGDLSAVSVASEEGSYQVSVGFNVRDVRFDEAGEQALVVTNDGISILQPAELEGDDFAPPVDVIPPSQADDYEVRDVVIETTADGEYVVAHRHDAPYLMVTELESENSYAVDLPGAPTDVELHETDDGVELFAMIRQEGLLLRADLPGGLAYAAEQQEEDGEEDENGDNGDDNGDEENGDNGDDNGDEENGDNGDDNGDEENGDNGDNGEEENGDEPPESYEGFEFIELPFEGLGVIEISGDESTAMLFSTVDEMTDAVLYDLEDDTAEELSFAKVIQGVLPDERGSTYMVFHDREIDGPTDGLSPSDPEYIKRKWGVTLFDVGTGHKELITTDLEPGDAALWSPETGDAVAYMTYEEPEAGDVKSAHHDVLRVNLSTYSSRTFRLSSLPDGLGVIPEAEQVFINQVHPQGRMTFADVKTDDLQTITGYQLNAGIE